ncbi:outer membrane protein [Chelativorans sp. Marseille-P2723]|uniref:outer membrane protein n=1 Tax=Chelativorans sp. Marseille-P2723 TaxID=2709133 RepID=UPI00156EF828|nr:outer membrane protein [Chelativorans sp. Marseille-P2723]
MKRVLLTTTAIFFSAGVTLAADMVTYEPAPIAPPAPERFSWEGPYVGLFGGLATGETEYTAGEIGGPGDIDVDVSSSGFLGGVQAGYDWQSGNFVFGVVADIAASSYGPSISISGLADVDIDSNLDYLGTVRGRVGHAMDRTLFYVHGGFAFGKTEQDITIDGIEFFDEDQTRTGWTLGAGFEFAVTDRISLGAEYAYVDLGSEEVFSDDAIDIFVDEDYRFHTLRAMVNFRF